MPKQIRAYPRSARKQQVIKQLMIWRENGYAMEATSYRLAKALNLTPQSTFAAILNEMVEEGDLRVEVREQPGRYPTKFYSLSEARVLSRVISRRKIAVKSRGQVVGQMEMFS